MRQLQSPRRFARAEGLDYHKGSLCHGRLPPLCGLAGLVASSSPGFRPRHPRLAHDNPLGFEKSDIGSNEDTGMNGPFAKGGLQLAPTNCITDAHTLEAGYNMLT